MRSTHTYAALEVSSAAYDEIRVLLEAAGYEHAFLENGAIDMHGIGLTRASAAEDPGEEAVERFEKIRWDAINAWQKRMTKYVSHGHKEARRVGMRAVLAAIPLDSADNAKGESWQCFHCGEVFTDRENAALHFGASERQQPACLIDVAEYRRMESMEARYAEEDADVHRSMRRMQSDHQKALQRAEEEGYARGLRDSGKCPCATPHPAADADDAAVDRFAVAMKEKLAAARAKGRGGWNDKGDCTQQFLSDLLRGHVGKGDPRDVANFCMFLHQRGESILPADSDAGCVS